MNKQNEFVGMNTIDSHVKSTKGQWNIHNCKYSESGLRWRFQDKDHNVSNVISKNTIQATYPLLPLHDKVALKIVVHDSMFDIGLINAPHEQDTLHIWWDVEKKWYNASYTQCGCCPDAQTANQDCLANDAREQANESANNAGEKAKEVIHRAAEHIKDAMHTVTDTARDLSHKSSATLKKIFTTASPVQITSDAQSNADQNNAHQAAFSNERLVEQTIIVLQQFENPHHERNDVLDEGCKEPEESNKQ